MPYILIEIIIMAWFDPLIREPSPERQSSFLGRRPPALPEVPAFERPEQFTKISIHQPSLKIVPGMGSMLQP